MMRYQRVVTPDTCNPLSNTNNTNNNNNHVAVGGGGGGGGSGGGDVLFQWGQKKRARVSRSFADESSSSSSASANKIKQQQLINNNNKLHKTTTPPVTVTATTTTTAVMPPPLPRRINKDFSSIRNLDERSAAGNGSPSRNTSVAASRAISRSAAAKRSPTPEKVDKKSPKKDEKLNGSLADNNVTRFDSASGQSEKEVKAVVGGGQKVHQEWPRIYVNLSKKEKEEDFMAMRGTKLPHRPKKRPKNVDRALQYCFPGMWLPDVTKSRYEVREKKCVKKQKRRGGLKGMESMETDSE